MLLVFLLSAILSIVLILMNSTISKKVCLDREKPSPFECGFDPKSSARLPFSLRFYLVAVIFLIFDVEITLIMPIPILINQMHFLPMVMITVFFLIILVVGLIHEWNQGALEWDG